jgi:hypothetical protein
MHPVPHRNKTVWWREMQFCPVVTGSTRACSSISSHRNYLGWRRLNQLSNRDNQFCWERGLGLVEGTSTSSHRICKLFLWLILRFSHPNRQLWEHAHFSFTWFFWLLNFKRGEEALASTFKWGKTINQDNFFVGDKKKWTVSYRDMSGATPLMLSECDSPN